MEQLAQGAVLPRRLGEDLELIAVSRFMRRQLLLAISVREAIVVFGPLPTSRHNGTFLLRPLLMRVPIISDTPPRRGSLGVHRIPLGNGHLDSFNFIILSEIARAEFTII